MVKIAIEEIMAISERRGQINHLSLDEIIWTENGIEVDVPQERIDQWDLGGLNNFDFITSGFYKWGWGEEE
jgi:hypothetical protein